ncbi:secondary metabolism biosynthetic enzyme [Penicillium alfredii]|uniref:Secondary metabolism biosynthetic enzyme n=1 Tax=Penicillium alfredii TaxID=1506179 RepID=A0A9W9F1J9_9EURO|nr:secondary metabolism biosynthetic enzyme [Penicillium alfredii]KAJ5091780.1 secondary metabolism biosynthetic enzyme [Penicillium alfredii]
MGEILILGHYNLCWHSVAERSKIPNDWLSHAPVLLHDGATNRVELGAQVNDLSTALFSLVLILVLGKSVIVSGQPTRLSFALTGVRMRMSMEDSEPNVLASPNQQDSFNSWDRGCVTKLLDPSGSVNLPDTLHRTLKMM